jgi:hypothetical protein
VSAGELEPVDLGELAPVDPPETGYDLTQSPLWAYADRHSLWGRIVTDPREVAAIRARVGTSRQHLVLVENGVGLAARVGSRLYSVALGVVVLAGVVGGWPR